MADRDIEGPNLLSEWLPALELHDGVTTAWKIMSEATAITETYLERTRTTS